MLMYRDAIVTAPSSHQVRAISQRWQKRYAAIHHDEHRGPSRRPMRHVWLPAS
jgi:hypothetical protein